MRRKVARFIFEYIDVDTLGTTHAYTRKISLSYVCLGKSFATVFQKQSKWNLSWYYSILFYGFSVFLFYPDCITEVRVYLTLVYTVTIFLFCTFRIFVTSFK